MPVFSDGQKMSKALVWDRMIQSVPASYMVWKDGSTYRAECLLKGGTDYSGTDAATVIQAAIDALQYSGRLFFKEGVYDLGTTTLNLASYTTIVGAGRGIGSSQGTILTYSGSGGALNVGTMDEVVVRDLCVKVTGDNGKCVTMDSGALLNYFDNCLFVGTKKSGQIGAYLVPSGSDGSYWNLFGRCQFNNLGTGVYLNKSASGAVFNVLRLHQCSWYNMLNYGINVDYGNSLEVFGGTMDYSAGATGIRLDHCTGAFIFGIVIELGTNSTGINFTENSERCTFIGRTNCPNSDINLGTLNWIIDAGIREFHPPWSNSGSATGTGSQQTIAHGCDFTPSKENVILSNIDDGANPYLSAEPDATNIYVTAVNGKKYRWEVKR